MAQLITLAGQVADVFLVDRSPQRVQALHRQGREWLGLDDAGIEGVLGTVAEAIGPMAQVFDVPMPDAADIPAVLAEAKDALVTLTLQSQQQVAQMAVCNEELREAAEHDPLTGLSNRRALQRRLDEEFRRADRFLRPLSVLFVDVDHFKAINDTFGHDVGDEVLSRLGRILQWACRGSDVVARYGGEEFVCLLPETHPHSAASLAENLRQAVESAEFSHDGCVFPVTVSIGLAGLSRDCHVTGGEQLLLMADQALYRAKNRGRNRVELSKPATPHEAPLAK
jgi:diguanylate cyclase (GGDEF)-like protein